MATRSNREHIENAAHVTVEVEAVPGRWPRSCATDVLYQAARDHWPFVAAYAALTPRRFPVIQLSPID